ncbi:ABC transporter ATP-binding protein [Pseudalkalibacillus decolorationis]|uniref:ABC transporter ATP-binding protein n=1 Tax=Pseudalkalibacillus decolorationis TaxID=163879 RepID=UPI002149700A|nr:ABC transporter ATP-binding protein [Pseudalkalibacillus decolorationis]
MRKILSYTSTYKKAVWIAVFLMGIELVVELVQPLFMAKIIDEGIMKGDMSVVGLWGGILLGLSFIAFAAGISSSFYAAQASQGVGHDIRRDIFQKVQQFTRKNFGSFSTPGLITRITNDVIQIQNLLFMMMRIALRAPLFILFGMVMAFFIHPGLATILVISVPSLLLFLFWILKKGVKLFRRVQNKLDRVNTVIRENLAGIRLIKGFNRGVYEENRFEDVNGSLMNDNKKALWITELAMPIVMLGMNIVILIILWIGATKLNMKSAQAGELVAIINYATRMMFTFSVFTFLIMNFSRGNASAGRIRKVLDEETEGLDELGGSECPSLKGGISFENVSFEFSPSDGPALKDLSFTAHVGETIGILGETGSGKTSLLQLIPRLLDITTGRVLLDGVDIHKLNVEHIRKQISLVPQEAHLFSGTIKGNIGWGKDHATMEDIIQAAKKAQIHDFIMSLPGSYDAQIGQKGVTFSGGQKQRLSLARALVRDPKILLLDDSTSALDAHTEMKLLQTLKEMQCTVLIVAQKISSIQEADQILLLNQGKIIGNGDHETLLKTNVYYQSVYQSQLQEEVI